jgi:hypothetical protein
MASFPRLYVLRCEDKAAHARRSRCAIPYIQPSAIHAHACRHTKYKHARMPGTYAYPRSSAHRNSIYHAQTYVLMRAGYVLHSLECLECKVVGKFCSNVLRSLRAYVVRPKAGLTCVRRPIQCMCVDHDAQSHTHTSARSCTPMHTCMSTYPIQTCVHAWHVYLPSFQCTTQ